MAMDYPSQVDGMLILAGLADPEHESRPFFLYPLRSKWLRWLLPPDMDVSNREILPLKEELYEMERKNMWEEIIAKTTIIQGQKDILVAMEHADYAEEMMINAPTRVMRMPKENHFIPWTQKELVKESIFELYENLD
jgi:pimeloyl-ACP methyl ester carboxylesterase